MLAGGVARKEAPLASNPQLYSRVEAEVAPFFEEGGTVHFEDARQDSRLLVKVVEQMFEDCGFHFRVELLVGGTGLNFAGNPFS